ncbi:MAG: FAD-dependent oxidoreductase [Pseudomonadota bacterium]
MAETADIAVVGGGIHGCSAALHLAARGYRVVVLEKDRVGAHASGVNAGGVRRLGRATAEVPLAVAAAAYWQDIRGLVDDACGHRVSRYLKVARSEAELSAAERRVAVLRQQGFTHEGVIGPEELRRLLPAAAPDCIGALHVEGDGYANPFRTTAAFRRRAERLGARVCEGTAVGAVRREGSGWRLETARGEVTAAEIVNTAGAWGGALAARLGDRVPLEAHAPMLAVTAPLTPLVDAVVGSLGAALSLKQLPNGAVLIGGGVRGRAELASGRTTLDLRGLAQFLATARAVFPALAQARIVRSWAGIEGYTPDHLPVIGRGTAEGVVHAFGFSAHGFQLAPAVGAMVADLVEGRTPALDLAEFAPGRFSEPSGLRTSRRAGAGSSRAARQARFRGSGWSR